MVFNPYDMLAVTDEALDKGGVELLRAGLGDEETVYVSARRGFENPERWGAVLAAVTRGIAARYAVDGDVTSDDAAAEIAAAYLQALGLPAAQPAVRKRAAPPRKARLVKPPAKGSAKRPAPGLKARGRTATRPVTKSATRPAAKPRPGSSGKPRTATRSKTATRSRTAAKTRTARR